MNNIIALALIITTTCTLAAVSESKVRAEQLRQQLNISKTIEKNSSYTKAFNAYVSLIEAGASGFEILSEAWAYDSISESNWLNWSYDYMTKFEKNKSQKYYRAYKIFVSEKLENDSAFAKAILQKLLFNKIYDSDDAIFSWLQDEYIGYRHIGYMALKKKYPDIGNFDYSEIDSKRSIQLNKIMSQISKGKSR